MHLGILPNSFTFFLNTMRGNVLIESLWNTEAVGDMELRLDMAQSDDLDDLEGSGGVEQ